MAEINLEGGNNIYSFGGALLETFKESFIMNQRNHPKFSNLNLKVKKIGLLKGKINHDISRLSLEKVNRWLNTNLAEFYFGYLGDQLVCYIDYKSSGDLRLLLQPELENYFQLRKVRLVSLEDAIKLKETPSVEIKTETNQGETFSGSDTAKELAAKNRKENEALGKKF